MLTVLALFTFIDRVIAGSHARNLNDTVRDFITTEAPKVFTVKSLILPFKPSSLANESCTMVSWLAESSNAIVRNVLPLHVTYTGTN